MVVDSIPIGELIIFIFSLWCQDKAKRRAPPLNSKCFENWAESEGWKESEMKV